VGKFGELTGEGRVGRGMGGGVEGAWDGESEWG